MIREIAVRVGLCDAAAVGCQGLSGGLSGGLLKRGVWSLPGVFEEAGGWTGRGDKTLILESCSGAVLSAGGSDVSGRWSLGPEIMRS